MKKKGFVTIGYGNTGALKFINELKKLRVNCIVDVRTRPYSKYNLGFNKEEFRTRLEEEGISYFWFGKTLGERYDKISLCDSCGVVSYEKIAMTENFKSGIEELKKLIPKYNVCIMCSEQDPLKCHRFLLISRYLKEYNIYHVMPDFSLVKNEILEQRLFDNFFMFRQMSLFEEDDESFESIAYRKQCQKVAYVSTKVQEWLKNGITEDFPEKTRLYTIGCKEKNAEEFFTLLQRHKVKRIIDVRLRNEDMRPAFAMYPDIAYYCKINQIKYERKENLIPEWQDICLLAENHISIADFSRRYATMLENKKVLLELMTEELNQTCFLGLEKDYKKCYRSLITKALRTKIDNVIVRHLK